MSLANKYRPKNFDTIIGQNHITSILKAKMNSDKAGNSNFLLCGPRGTGKTSSARILAKAINCLNIQDGNPCNECANCKIIEEGKTLDYVEIDAASHTGVDNIREEILDKTIYPPTMLKKKIYVIDEVHMLSKGAFNALLKTIEEPKDTMAFILATTDVHKVPETIISRCQVFNFRKVHEAEMVEHLEKICKSEGVEYETKALSLIAKISEGCVRDAVKYIDQVSILENITEENVTKFLGIASEQTITDFIKYIVDGNTELLFEKIESLVEKGVDLQHFAKQVLMFLDDNLFENLELYLNISEQFGEILAEIRNYPYPALVYKIVLHKNLNKTSGNIIEKKTEIINKEVEKPVIPQINISTETIKKPDDSFTKNDDTNIIQKQETEQNNTSNESQTNSSDIQNLWERTVNRIEKESLQKNLKDLSSISSLEDGIVNIVVINKFAQMALENKENKSHIENILSEEYGSKLYIKVTFQSKEEFFSKMLG